MSDKDDAAFLKRLRKAAVYMSVLAGIFLIYCIIFNVFIIWLFKSNYDDIDCIPKDFFYEQVTLAIAYKSLWYIIIPIQLLFVVLPALTAYRWAPDAFKSGSRRNWVLTPNLPKVFLITESVFLLLVIFMQISLYLPVLFQIDE